MAELIIKPVIELPDPDRCIDAIQAVEYQRWGPQAKADGFDFSRYHPQKGLAFTKYEWLGVQSERHPYLLVAAVDEDGSLAGYAAHVLTKEKNILTLGEIRKGRHMPAYDNADDIHNSRGDAIYTVNVTAADNAPKGISVALLGKVKDGMQKAGKKGAFTSWNHSHPYLSTREIACNFWSGMNHYIPRPDTADEGWGPVALDGQRAFTVATGMTAFEWRPGYEERQVLLKEALQHFDFLEAEMPFPGLSDAIRAVRFTREYDLDERFTILYELYKVDLSDQLGEEDPFYHSALAADLKAIKREIERQKQGS